MENYLIKGDALNPDSNDMLAQTVYLPHPGRPKGNGWQVMTGNGHGNLWARVAYRFEASQTPESI